MEQVVDIGLPAKREPRAANAAVAAARRLAFDEDVTDTPSKDAAPGELTADALIALMREVAENRSREAFSQLFQHFAPRLKSYLMRQGAGPEPAEELAQEAMIMVWRKAESFDPGQAAVSTWIFRIARNKQIDAIRREKRPEVDWTDPALQPEQPEEADKSLEAAQREDRIREVMKELPEEQAEMVRLAFFEDKAHSAIAEATGLPLGTVKSRLRLALAKLRAQLEEE